METHETQEIEDIFEKDEQLTLVFYQKYGEMPNVHKHGIQFLRQFILFKQYEDNQREF